MDPWHSLGVANPTDPFYQAGYNNVTRDPAALQQLRRCPNPTPASAACVSVVELSGTAHCRDMYAPNAFMSLPHDPLPDPPSVTAAHATIAADVARYLGPTPAPPPPTPPAPPTPLPSFR